MMIHKARMEARRNSSEQLLEKEDKNDEAICLSLLWSIFDELTKFHLKPSDLEKTDRRKLG